MTRPRKLNVERLEERTTPTTFGIPWPDAGHLTLSFAPDGTAIAGRGSNLFAALDSSQATPDWQREILRAFQTWAVHSNINLSVRSDGGQPFGTSGRLQRDPRFGDIRVGALPLSSEVLAVSVPPDLFRAGTWAGDLLLNSSYPVTADALYRVVLHEMGNILGLSDSTDPGSVLFPRFTAQAELSPGDIAALQALYGTRTPDALEGPSGNETFHTAALIRHPAMSQGDYNGTRPVVLFGDITTPQDVDVFSFRPFGNYSGPVTFILQTAGVSLLAPRLTVFDASGQVLGAAASSDPLGAVVSVRLPAVLPNRNYHVRVQGAAGDVFGIGSYGLAVTYDASLAVSPDILGQVLRGPYETLSAEEIDRLLRDATQTFLNDDQHINDSFSRATVLMTTSFDDALNTHAEILASLSDAADVDVYRLQASTTQPGQVNVLTATVWGINNSETAPRIILFDGNHRPVSSEILVNGNGMYTIQASLSGAGGAHYLRVAAPPGADGWLGNYFLQIHLGQRVADLEPLTSGILDAAVPEQSSILNVARSQLFQWTLSAEALGAPAGAAVSLTLFDSQGQEVFRLAAPAGETVTGAGVLLSPGAYTASISLQVPPEGPAPALVFHLWVTGLADPIGPAVDDSTLLPLYTTPTEPTVYQYPGDIFSLSELFCTSRTNLGCQDSQVLTFRRSIWPLGKAGQKLENK